MSRSIWLAAVVLLGLGAGVAQNNKVVMGQEKMLFGAPVTSWGKLDANGKVIEVGVTLALRTIEQAPVPSPNDKPPADGGPNFGPAAVLEFPEVVKNSTSLDNLQLWWEGFGHPPDRYLAPHFDLHFFGIPAPQVAKIDCKDLTPPALELTPKGYAPAVPPGGDAAEFCVPLMGFHGLPLTEFSGPGQLKPGLFDYVLISGFYRGSFIFTEPMITRAFLLTKQNLRIPVSRPEKTGRQTLYPTVFTATYDSTKAAYQLVYSGFEMGN